MPRVAPSEIISEDQKKFEMGIEILNEHYFKEYCRKELSLKPSELTKEEWETNMKQFLKAVKEEWVKRFSK